MDKNHPGQNPRTNTPRKIKRELVQRAFVQVFCTRPTKNRGRGPRCVTYFLEEVPGCVTKCDRGGGSKLAQNSVTYFMDGPGLVHPSLPWSSSAFSSHMPMQCCVW